MNKIHIVIVCKNLFYGQSLALSLPDQAAINVVEVTSKADSALELVRAKTPDFVLIDMDLANVSVLNLIRSISAEMPSVKLILLGLPDDELLILEGIEAGAHGYVLENESLEGLRTIVYSVHRGEAVCSPKVVYSLFTKISELAWNGSNKRLLELLNLTPREIEVLYLIADGLSNKEIAKQINLSLHTIKNHVHNMLEKLHVNNRSELVRFALSKGLMDPSRMH
jgi:two-component system, NarL family, nitrate/nitrite response regulator NarL